MAAMDDSCQVASWDAIAQFTLRGVSCKSLMLASNPAAAAQMYDGPFAQMARRLQLPGDPTWLANPRKWIEMEVSMGRSFVNGGFKGDSRGL